MNRGVDHQTVFFADDDRIEFGRRLAWVHDELDVTTLAYCLMDNHFHLLLDAPGDALSLGMQHVLGVYTRHTNDRVGRDGPLFRGRFHSIPVETDAYLLQATRYIHRNPLALHGISSPADYRWSSYRSYIGLRRSPRFLAVAQVRGLLGGPAGVATFTEDEDGTRPDGPIDAGQLRRIVECAIAVDDLTHDQDGATTRRLTRTIFVLVADRTTDPELRDVVRRELAHRSPSTASSARGRARQRLEVDPVVQRVLAWVEAELRGTSAVVSSGV